MSEKVFLFDTTLRDGEQVPGCQLNTTEKIEVALALESLGVDIIEAGFPISSPGDFQSIIAISKAVKEPVICALSRALPKDIEAAAESLRYAKRKRIHTGIGVSDYHIQYKFKSNYEQIIERAVKAVKLARNLIDDVEFYAEDAGRSNPEFLIRIVEAVIAAGATVINVPDTTGYCTPDEYGGKIAFIKNNVPNIDKAILSVHCHNDLGLATANSLSGVLNGARQVEVTINGIGERAGNTSLEEIAMILQTREDVPFHTQIKSDKIYATSRLVSKLMRMLVQPNKSIVGRNAFAHSSGIHQDGFLKNKINYEIIAPETVGVPQSSIILTARSGRAALKYRLTRLGLDYEKEGIDALYERFLKMADQKKTMEDSDLLTLSGYKDEDYRIVLVSIETVSQNESPKGKCRLELKVGDLKIPSQAEGNGPIDATLKAIDKIIESDLVIENYNLQQITEGSDDACRVHMEINYEGLLYYGYGYDTSIVLASISAYLDGINKIPSLCIKIKNKYSVQS